MLRYIALQAMCGFTHSQMRKLAALLKLFTGFRVLTSQHKRESYQNKYENKLIIANYPGEEDSDNKIYYKALDEVFLNTLRGICENEPTIPLGIKAYNTECIVVLLNADKGGKENEVKFVSSITAREGDNQKYCCQVGGYKGSDKYISMQRTNLCLGFDEDLRNLDAQSALVVNLANSYVFAMIPRECGDVDELIFLIDEEFCCGIFFTDNNYLFDNNAKIPADKTVWKSIKILPVFCHLNGDLAQLMAFQGRENFSGNKCVYCKSRSDHWPNDQRKKYIVPLQLMLPPNSVILKKTRTILAFAAVTNFSLNVSQ
jgi:hypothetical protein